MADRVFTVSQLTFSIKQAILEQFHQKIKVEGEISNYKLHSSGHLYYSLKDDKSVIKCVMFSASRILKTNFKDGDRVIVTGSVNVYEMQGVYQVYTDSIEPAGEGDLYKEFIRIKEKLQKEGLFDESAKKPLPPYPVSVGIITSPTGAVIQDITNVLMRRAPYVKKYLFPASVQGETAYKSIIKGIEYFNSKIIPDIIIIARGGGSIEDLWPFNNELLARAISSSAVPVVSAIGHETDFTIADFVSDVRAPTPSAAAELAVRDTKELLSYLDSCRSSIKQSLISSIERVSSSMSVLRKNFYIYSLNPINSARNRVSSLADEAEKTLSSRISDRLNFLSESEMSLHRLSPSAKAAETSSRLNIFRESVHSSISAALEKKMSFIRTAAGIIESHSPLYLLKKGYSIVYDEKNDIIKSYGDVSKKDRLRIAVSDGFISSEVISTEEAKGGSGKSGKENKRD